MNESSFSIHSHTQNFYIKNKEISASFDKLNSYLNFHIHFDLIHPFQDGLVNISGFSAKLVCDNTILSNIYEIVDFNTSVNPSKVTKENHFFSFLLNDRAIELIEKNRKGNCRLRIELNGYAKFIRMDYLKSTNYRINPSIEIDIPQSIWVKELLPKLNYQSFTIIEVPITHKTLKEAYDNIFKEFDKANGYFKEHKYDDCVGACRKTMDILTRNLKKIKDQIPSDSNFDWLKRINSNTLLWIDSINKTNQSVTSKPHHSGDSEFSRHETEAIYLVTLGLMNFIGHIKE